MKYGMLTFVADEGTRQRKSGAWERWWRMRCDCGSETVTRADGVKRGHTKSCGCNRLGRALEARQKHGMTRSPEHKTWVHIKQRCLNPKATAYYKYGARGITVHEAWINDFNAFYQEVGPKPSPAHSIDRIDNSRGYEPGNVRWATSLEQSRNKRGTVMVPIGGRLVSLREYCTLAGISYSLVLTRRYRGMPIGIPELDALL